MTVRKKLGSTDDHYVKVPNSVARDFRLTSNAYRILTYIMSFSYDWQTSKRRLAEQTNMGRDAVRSAVDLLIDLGYVETEQSDPEDPSTIEYIFSWEGEPPRSDNPTGPPVGKSNRPRSGNPTTTKEHSNERKKLSNKRAHEQDEQPDDPPPQPDPVSTDPPDDLTQWIVWRGARMDYDISPQQAMKVAMGVADFGLGDDEERRYIRETMTSCAIAEKAPGQWAYYVVQRGNYETWAGNGGGPDGGPGGNGMGLFDRLK